MNKQVAEALSSLVADYRNGTFSIAMLRGFVADAINDDALLSDAMRGTRWGWIWADDTPDWMRQER